MRPRQRATALLTGHGVLLLTALALLASGAEDPVRVTHPGFLLAGATPAALVAALLADRRPGTAVGRCLAVLATNQLAMVAGLLAASAAGLGSELRDRAADVAFVGTLPVLAVLVVVFPDGAEGRWRVVARGQVCALGVAAVLAAATPTGSGARGLAHVAALACVLPALPRTAVLVHAWWRSTGEERLQYAWFVAAAASLVALYLVGAVLRSLRVESVDGFATAYVLGVLPAALGLSIARRRLYELDLVVNRALVLVLTSAALLVAYLGAAAVAGATSAEPGRPVVSATLAVATALAFGPVRTAAQGLVDRALYGDRDEPGRALRRLGQRLAETLAPDEVPDRVVEAVRAATRSPSVTLLHDVAPGPDDFVVEHAGVRLGVLRVAPRPGEDSLSGRDRALLEDLARHAAVALYAGRLSEELAASRERLVTSRLDERARLRRDLHDELSPTLAGIALSVAAARAHLDDDRAATADLLTGVAAEAQAATGVVRRVLAGLHPPGLGELGLVAAVERRALELSAGTGVCVHVTVEGVPAVPIELETVAYRVAVEAVTNALRHSGATTVEVALSQNDDLLVVAVTDDGTGPPGPEREGTGLAACRSRVDEVGGRLDITAGRGRQGTQLRAALPLRHGGTGPGR